MHTERFTFRIQRFDPAKDDAPYYQTYTLDVPQGLTVLEALLRIQAQQDGSLAFRYACRGAVCGSCAMRVNGREALACRTQVHGLLEEERTIYQGLDRKLTKGYAKDARTITVEPLRNTEVIKDLVVDMEPFFGKTTAVEPWLQPNGPDPERERLVKPMRWAEAEPYTNCILCGCCYSVCPVEAADPQYLGPAALAQHYRFLADVRDGADERRLTLVGGEHGVGGCDFVWNCVEICPKGVPPTKGIAKTRGRITREERSRERKG
ncbi:MAG: succinate dehydrogenase/fumarate reductase iron-sulfur subunit [Anaerolineae bacterium]